MTARLAIDRADVEVRAAPWRRAVLLLRGVTLQLAAGEVVAVIGASGSGKSTLGQLAAGLIRPARGAVSVDGRPPATHPGVQWLSQDPSSLLNPALPVGLQVRESQRAHGTDGDLLAAVGLSDRADALPHALSGGERRRASLARALAARPALLIADESTAGLDAPRRAAMLDLLLALRPAGCAVLLITHDLGLLPGRCDRWLRMDAGAIIAAGLPDELPTVDPIGDRASRAVRKLPATSGVGDRLKPGGGDGAR